MRRRCAMAAAVMLAAVPLAATACTTGPPVGDGVIDSGWARFPEPIVPRPDSRVCRNSPILRVDWQVLTQSSPAYSCDQQHSTETFHVGTLTGEAASQVDVPELGDAVYRAAYRECADEAEEFLGGDWHLARVAIVPVLPTGRQWRGDARWFRCEIIEVADALETAVPRDQSLRDGLRGAKSAALTCASDTLGQDTDVNITYQSCNQPHTVELTGLYTARDGTYPGFETAVDRALDACFDIGARYIGVTPTELDNRGGIRWIAWERGEGPWSIGDLSTRCFLGPHPSRKFRGTIKGKRLPL